MTKSEAITLNREVKAIQIPSGMPTVIEAGTQVRVMQQLGGNYTVSSDIGLFRIYGKDGDALGFTPEPVSQMAVSKDGKVDEELIWDQLRTCYDPEIPVNIVDLGLVYDCHIVPMSDGGNRVEVKMTLTAPGCSMGEVIKMDAENKIMGVPGVTEAQVELVWDPPWNQSMISESAKLELGLM